MRRCFSFILMIDLSGVFGYAVLEKPVTLLAIYVSTARYVATGGMRGIKEPLKFFGEIKADILRRFLVS